MVDLGPDGGEHVPHDLGHLEHGGGEHDRGLAGGIGILDRLAQAGEGGLGDREAARGHDDDDAFARVLEGEHLAVGRDVVEARVGAGVREADHAFVQKKPHAVGHARSCKFRGAQGNPLLSGEDVAGGAGIGKGGAGFRTPAPPRDFSARMNGGEGAEGTGVRGAAFEKGLRDVDAGRPRWVCGEGARRLSGGSPTGGGAGRQGGTVEERKGSPFGPLGALAGGRSGTVRVMGRQPEERPGAGQGRRGRSAVRRAGGNGASCRRAGRMPCLPRAAVGARGAVGMGAQ